MYISENININREGTAYPSRYNPDIDLKYYYTFVVPAQSDRCYWETQIISPYVDFPFGPIIQIFNRRDV